MKKTERGGEKEGTELVVLRSTASDRKPGTTHRRGAQRTGLRKARESRRQKTQGERNIEMKG